MDSDIRRRLLWVQLYQRIGNAGLLCRRCGVSHPTLGSAGRRFHEEGQAGLLSHSRRPVRSPDRRVVEKERRLVLSLRVERKLGAQRIQSELRCHHDLKLSFDSIHKVLAIGAPDAAQDATPACRLIPVDRVQLDTCKIAPECYQYTALDDCMRYRVLAIFRRRTAASTLAFLERVLKEMPFPVQWLNESTSVLLWPSAMLSCRGSSRRSKTDQ